MLTYAHKETRKTVCSELLEQYKNGEDDFLARIVTGDETWLQHCEPVTERQSMECIMQTHQRRNSKLRLQ